MPSLAALGIDLAPLREPQCYPGRPAPFSGLLVGSWLYPWPQDGADPERPVTIDGGPLQAALPRGSSAGVDRVLAVLGVAPMARRRAVLAVGSNAAPAQLRAKAPTGTGPVVPMSWVSVPGLAVGHSAHVSAAGYVAYAPAAGPARRAQPFLQLWLDEDDLARLDATEPNYHRWETGVTGGRGPALYRSRRGLLRVPGRAPTPAGPQAAVWAELATQPRFAELLPPPPRTRRRGGPVPVPEARRRWTPEITRVMAADPDRREELNRRLHAAGWSVEDGLADLPGVIRARRS